MNTKQALWLINRDFICGYYHFIVIIRPVTITIIIDSLFIYIFVRCFIAEYNCHFPVFVPVSSLSQV
jgi:hypothetical protein